MTWSPLACGIVSGKYDGGIPPYSRASLKVSLAGGRVATGGQSRGSGARGVARSLWEQEVQEPRPGERGDALPARGRGTPQRDSPPPRRDTSG